MQGSLNSHCGTFTSWCPRILIRVCGVFLVTACCWVPFPRFTVKCKGLGDSALSSKNVPSESGFERLWRVSHAQCYLGSVHPIVFIEKTSLPSFSMLAGKRKCACFCYISFWQNGENSYEKQVDNKVSNTRKSGSITSASPGRES